MILAEVRETSRKPEELYDMVERILGPRGRKVELFGREHNLREGWVTVGNQFATDAQIFEPEMVSALQARYPERNVHAAELLV